MCLSHSRTTKLIRQLGDGHDSAVLEWKTKAETRQPSIIDRPGSPESETSHGSQETQTSQSSQENVATGTSASSRTSSSSSSASKLKLASLETCMHVLPLQAMIPKHYSVAINHMFLLTYAIVGDNLDKTINPRYMTFEHQRQSLHYFHSYAVLDRVNCGDLPSDVRAGDVKSLSFAAFLPTPEDCSTIRYNYSALLGRVLVEKLSFFKKFQDCIPKHIIHQHFEEMKKSTVVSRYSRLIFCKRKQVTNNFYSLLGTSRNYYKE